MISIIVPVYNVEKYLARCLNSIYEQATFDYEVILIDDGSTDCSGNICDEYARTKDNTRVIHKTNSGLYQARLDGIGIANGNWILFLDADDWLMPNSLNIISYKIAENSMVDFILFRNCQNGNVEDTIDNSVTEGLYADNNLSVIYDTFIYSESINAVWKKVFKSSLLKNNEFLKNISHFNYGEDVYITACAMIYTHSVLVIEDVLYSYRNLDGMTKKYKRERTRDQMIAFRGYDLLLDNMELDNKKDDYIKALKNKFTKECLMELWILIESGLTFKETIDEMKYMFNNRVFKTGLSNDDFQPSIWWEKYLYKGMKSAVNNYIVVISLRIIRNIEKKLRAIID